MTEETALLIWLGLGAWMGFGLVVGLGVITFGLRRLTPSAASMPLRVRLLVLPGLAALWPVVVLRLIGIRPQEDRL